MSPNNLKTKAPGRTGATLEWHEQLRFQVLLTEISTKFVNLPTNQIDAAISDAQRRICESIHIDRCSLWQQPQDNHGILLLTNVYEISGSPSAKPGLNASELFPWTLKKIMAGEIIPIPSLSDLPHEAAQDRKNFQRFGTKSGVVVPLRVGANVLGAMSFTIMREERNWPSKFIEKAQLVAQVFANALDRKRLDEALLECQSFVEVSLDCVPAGIWSIQFDPPKMWVSLRMRRLAGLAPDGEIRPEQFLQLVHPGDREAVDRAVRKASEERAGFRFEHRVLLPDGSIRWVEAHGRFQPGVSGESGRLTGISMDITEKKSAEQEIARLRQQNWDSERQARTQIISASLAHELSQPLSAILSNAQTGLMLLSRENPDFEEVKEILTDIVSDDRRAGDVIQSLRNLFWNEKTPREDINLAEATRGVASMLQSEFQEHSIDVDMKNLTNCTVSAAEAQIQQVLFNLIMNAVEAVQMQPIQHRRISVKVVCSGNEAQVSICDSGPGIPKDRLARLLVEPFLTEKKGRIGIGLSICRSIIESHSGRLWLANNPDRGVTFYFTLPRSLPEPN